MRKEEVNFDYLKDKNPFKVPEGYMEGLTDQIMNVLPEKQEDEVDPVFFMDRIRPWLYMVAVFVGLGLFFKAILGIDSSESKSAGRELLVLTENQNEFSVDLEQNENEEYLDYLEAQYVNYLMDEELHAFR